MIIKQVDRLFGEKLFYFLVRFARDALALRAFDQVYHDHRCILCIRVTPDLEFGRVHAQEGVCQALQSLFLRLFYLEELVLRAGEPKLFHGAPMRL